MHRNTFVCFSLVIAILMMSCAGPRGPLTTRGFSSWDSRRGINAKAEFERVRTECLTRHAIDDAAGVEPNSPIEKRFAKCMQTKGWCSVRSGC